MSDELLFHLAAFLARNPGSKVTCYPTQPGEHTSPLVRCDLRDPLGYLVATSLAANEQRARQLLDLKLSLR